MFVEILPSIYLENITHMEHKNVREHEIKIKQWHRNKDNNLWQLKNRNRKILNKKILLVKKYTFWENFNKTGSQL
jgi:hypothetical protein